MIKSQVANKWGLVFPREFEVEDVMDILYKKAFNIVGEIGQCIWW